MSGILHRLAAQAMGLASPVRAAARLPFATLPALVEDPLPLATPGAIVDSPPASGPLVPRRVGERREPVRDTAPRFTTREREADDPASEAAEPPPALSPRRMLVAEPPPQIVAERRDGRLAPDPMEAMGSVRTPVAVIREAVPEGAWRDAPEGSRPGPERVAADVTHTPAVESLLPPRPATRGAGARGYPPRAALGAQTPGRSGPVEETTEVHVSIGRIEVTAVHEAPLAKRAAPRRAEPMTLEQYLARRRGGRP